MAETDGASSRLEAWLKQFEVEGYRYEPAFPFASIDRAASLNRRQGRLGKGLDEDHGILVGTAMRENPEAVEPIVVWMPASQNGKGLCVSGNHRVVFGEREASLKSWPAYVITQPLSELQLDLLIIDSNKHGKPYDLRENLAHAVLLIEKHGFTHAAAAARVGVPVTRVGARMRIVAADKRMEGLGLRKLVHKLSPTHREALGQIQSNPVLEKAARLVADLELGADPTKGLVQGIKKTPSEKEALALLERWRREKAEEIQAKKLGARPSQEVANLRSIISRIQQIDVEKLIEGIRQDERKPTKRLLTKAIDRMFAIEEAL